MQSGKLHTSINTLLVTIVVNIKMDSAKVQAICAKIIS